MKLRLEGGMVVMWNEVSWAELVSDLLLDSCQECVVFSVPVGTANEGEENEPPLLPRQLHGEERFCWAFQRFGGPAISPRTHFSSPLLAI